MDAEYDKCQLIYSTGECSLWKDGFLDFIYTFELYIWMFRSCSRLNNSWILVSQISHLWCCDILPRFVSKATECMKAATIVLEPYLSGHWLYRVVIMIWRYTFMQLAWYLPTALRTSMQGWQSISDREENPVLASIPENQVSMFPVSQCQECQAIREEGRQKGRAGRRCESGKGQQVKEPWWGNRGGSWCSSPSQKEQGPKMIQRIVTLWYVLFGASCGKPVQQNHRL